MKSIVFLALVAAAVAHWPYADQEDKFRVSGLSLLGSSLALDPTFHWVFSPLNNQLLPTFQMRFPHAPLATSNSKSGLVYTVVLDHLAEVRPSTGTFTLVPGTTLNFNELVWFTDTFTRFYDDESMGEVVEFVLSAYSTDDFEEATTTGELETPTPLELLTFPVSIRVRLFPDSADDLVDLSVFVESYDFVEYGQNADGVDVPDAHLALFWKIAASTGDEPSRNVPLSLDYDAMTFEVDADVKFTAAKKRGVWHKRNATKARREKSPVVANARTMKALAKASRQTTPPDMSTADHTTSQLWISGGYVATVVGVVPDDVTSYTGVNFQITSTIAVRTFRAVPEK